MTVDGSDLFSIKSEASRRIVERFVRLNKTNLKGGKIRVCKQIAAISELASSSFSNGQQQSSSSMFLSLDSLRDINKGIYETKGADIDFLDLMRYTGSHINNNKLNVIERTFAAALENCDNRKTSSNVAQESNLASSKMNRDIPFTEEILTGQVSSILVKQIASTDSIRGLHGRPILCSICTINSKTMDTLQVCRDKAKSGGVWGSVNSALRSVNAPFVDKKALYGEGCTVKMMIDEETSSTINMSSGLHLPDSVGIGRNGTIGVGDALMRQLVGSWGTANIKNSMYSCHHLHTMFELVMQETPIQKNLENVGDMSSDYMSNVAFLLISSLYIEMFERFGVFASNGDSGAKRMRFGVSAKEDPVNADGLSTYPMFMSMIVNKHRSLKLFDQSGLR
ncbi:hypothetical protein O3P69_014541 [Scylla paramamosain]|uniref:Uncharacterized protein n=1 Tax=Scylla paramamosain TaxID=85552 RepID=A0AAW0TBL7_SCYPA